MSGNIYLGCKTNRCHKDHLGKQDETRAMLSAKYYQMRERYRGIMVQMMRSFEILETSNKATLGWKQADMIKQLDYVRITRCSHLFALVAHKQILRRLMLVLMLSYCSL